MNLVIVESPAKAATIQKFLGEGFTVKASQGHIRDLEEKDLSIDVDNGFVPKYVVPAGKKRIVSDLKALAEKADTVWLASDEDREGEAISWHLVETLGIPEGKTKRIVFHEITRTAIQEAVKNPRKIDMNLVDAQQARRVLDRLVGFELSPVLWRKIKRGLSAGRVQSVALRLVVDREKEIICFNSTPFYKVDAFFNIDGKQAKAQLDRRFDTKEEAYKFLEDSIGATYTVASVDKKEGLRMPAAPFTTSTLQQEAAGKLHFSINATMQVAQRLYERGLITYMRTDSTNLSTLALGTAKQFIVENFGAQYHHSRQYKTRSKGAQEAHEAIRPTYIDNIEIEGTPQEKKLYDLIWKRTVASQMAEAKVLNTSVKVASDKRSETYSLQAAEILFDGFLKVYSESIDDDAVSEEGTVLPPVRTGQVLPSVKVEAACKFTQPPYRYSQRTLVKKLEELGIGRPSTYAPTITTLTKERGYIVTADKEGESRKVTDLTLKGNSITESERIEKIGAERGKLIPSEIGMIVTDYLVDSFSDILDYDFTANVEKTFDDIAEGKAKWQGAIKDFYSPFHERINSAMTDKNFRHIERELGTDPSDGKKIMAKLGQYGPYVQKGDASEKMFASLGNGQLIESLTLEDALKLFALPRTVGSYNGVPVEIRKGRFGAYIKAGDKNISLPKGKDPLNMTMEDCVSLIDAAQQAAAVNPVMAEFAGSGIQVINGRYGAYIKCNGSNYKIPRGTDPASLTEADCKAIIADPDNAPKARAAGRRWVRKK